MSQRYNQRSLVVLSLLGVLSAVMSVLSVMLIFQLQPQQAAAVKESPPSTSAVIPAAVWAVLLPVAAVLAALSLTLHLSSAVVCLLHSYFSTELCRGEQDTDRYLRCSSFTTRHRKEPDGAVHPQFRKKTAATGFRCLGHVHARRAPVGPDTVLQITDTGLTKVAATSSLGSGCLERDVNILQYNMGIVRKLSFEENFIFQRIWLTLCVKHSSASAMYVKFTLKQHYAVFSALK